jgi:uncharacterized protein
MNQDKVIQLTAEFVKKTLAGDASGHDWWHVFRVWQTARYLAEKEGADGYLVELGALLHDIADWKFHDGDLTAGSRVASAFLADLGVETLTVKAVCHIIDEVSFKGAGVQSTGLSLEARVVQDADRLDAMGAIGIGRAFAYGGFKKRSMHEPDVAPCLHSTFEAYKNSQSTTINHFHEKLLLLKDRINTSTGQKLAEDRHQLMKVFLRDFHAEWALGVD